MDVMSFIYCNKDRYVNFLKNLIKQQANMYLFWVKQFKSLCVE